MLLNIFDEVLLLSSMQKITSVCKPQSLSNCWIESSKIPPVFYPLLNNASKVFDVTKMAGVEFWAHSNTKTDWHYDKDEELFCTQGAMSYPLFSMVYYANIEKLLGGDLYFDNGIRIPPKTNRQIIFSPGLHHKVANFSGHRLSVLLNPWKEKPSGLPNIQEELLNSLR
jgi:hypothetical protein